MWVTVLLFLVSATVRASGYQPGASADCRNDVSAPPLKGCLESVIRSYALANPSGTEDGIYAMEAWDKAPDPAQFLAEDILRALRAKFQCAFFSAEHADSPSSLALRQSIWDELDLPAPTVTGPVLSTAKGADNPPSRASGGKGMLRRARLETETPAGAERVPHRDLEEVDFLEIGSTWVNVTLTFVCVVCAGLAAGLTMGLVSIEPLEMAIKQRSGTTVEKRQASRILPLVKQHHFLLVTLLLFNSLANEALPIFLGNLVPSWLAVILSVSLVLFFGEILPSAIFTGRNQLAIASGMAWLVYFLMFVLAPIAWPLSWLLDRVLGIEGYKRYNRAEIAALVEVQQELSTHDVTNVPLHPDEVAIVNGVLQTAERSVASSMITMDRVFCLRRDEKLGSDTMADIMASGYSRVLVYEGSDTRNIRGYLQVKKLIVLNPDDERDISSLVLRIPVVVPPNKSLLELLNTFQTGRSHLALVSNSPGLTLESLKSGARLEGAARPLGIITLEDIIEDIIQEEIMDESDYIIEKRARETLQRFALTRIREGKKLGRHAVLARTVSPRTPSPQEEAPENGTAAPLVVGPSEPSLFNRSLSSSRSFDAHDEPPAPPNLSERSRLLSHASQARRTPTAPRPQKRGTLADAMMAAAASSINGPGTAGTDDSVAGSDVGYGTSRLGQGKLFLPSRKQSSDPPK